VRLASTDVDNLLSSLALAAAEGGVLAQRFAPTATSLFRTNRRQKAIGRKKLGPLKLFHFHITSAGNGPNGFQVAVHTVEAPTGFFDAGGSEPYRSLTGEIKARALQHVTVGGDV